MRRSLRPTAALAHPAYRDACVRHNAKRGPSRAALVLAADAWKARADRLGGYRALAVAARDYPGASATERQLAAAVLDLLPHL